MTKKIEYMKHKLRFKIGSILHSFYVGDMTYTEALGQILKAFDWHCTTCNTVQEEKEQHANRDKTKTWEEEFDKAFEDGLFFFTGPPGSDWTAFLNWNKKLIRKTVQQRFIDRQELEKEIEGMRTHNYNQTKKDHCEYCGVKEGMCCKDGCEAMDERYKNKAIDDILKLIRKDNHE